VAQASARAPVASVLLASAPRAAPTRAVTASAQAPSRDVKPTGAPPSASAPGESAKDFYEVDLPKPLGVKFGRGNDGGAYISAIDARRGSVTDDMQVGDKVVKVSASFGAEVWDALNFGQVVYAMRTRNGNVYMKIKRNYGSEACFEEAEMTEAERLYKMEKAGGNYGAGSKEMQARNYASRKEAERERRELFDDALVKFRKGEAELALVDFENVIGMEPRNFVGDNFSRVTNIYRVAQYNVACCYAAVGAVDPGLEALDACLKAGFDDFKKVRSDPNLAPLRTDSRFLPVLEKYDEPVINREAINALKSIFPFGKK